MTNDTAITEQARAVFLAALMVLSVMVGTVALSGAAAAQITDLELSDDLVQGGDTIEVNGSVNANGTVYAFIDEDGDGNYSSSTDEVNSVTIDDYEEDGDYSITLEVPTESGTYDVYVLNDESGDEFEEGIEGEDSTPLKVDADAPTFGDESPEDDSTVNQENADEISIPIEDDNTSVDHIETTVENSDGEINTWKIDPNSADEDGVNWSSNELTISPGTGSVPALTDGSYVVSVSATDEVGNENTTEFTFDVSTNAPTFTDVSGIDGTLTNDENETVEISIDSNGYDIDNSTVMLTIDNGVDYTEPFDYEDDVYTNGTDTSTFEVDPSDENVTSFSEGDYTVSVSADNELGNSNDETYEFTVDTTSPSVADGGVSLTDSELNNSDINENDEQVVVTFDEAVVADSISATVLIDGEVETIDDFSATEAENEFSGNLSLDSGEYDGVETDSAVVNVTAAQDIAGNELANPDAEASNATFAVDTDGPSVELVGDEEANDGEFSGYMNFTSFVASTEDESDRTVEIVFEDSNLVAADITDTADNYDTTNLPDGKYLLKVTVEDENGNTASATEDFDLNNGDSITVQEEFLHGATGDYNVSVDGQLNLSEDVFSVEDGSTVDYEVNGEDAENFDANDYINGEVVTLSADHVTVDVKVDRLVLNGIETVGEDNPTKVQFQFNQELEELNATLQANDNYDDASWQDLLSEDEIELNETADDYTYETTVPDNIRDGEFEVVVEDAATSTQSVGTEGEVDSTTITIDNSAPTLTSAEILNADSDSLKVQAQFDEPVMGTDFDSADISVEGVDAEAYGGHTVDAEKGLIEISISEEFQTADAPNITVDANSVTEAEGDSTQNVETKTEINTISLTLEEGMNVISVPAVTGDVSLDEQFEELGKHDAVWAYDAGAEKWTSYTPDAKNDDDDLTALEGGQGYVVYVHEETEVKVNAENLPTAVGDDTPQVPTEQELAEGWNLVGHYQVGDQTQDEAFDSIEENLNQVWLGYSGDNPASLSPGQGYWVNVDESDSYNPTNFGEVGPDFFNVEADGSVADGETVNVTVQVDPDEQPVEDVVVNSHELDINDVALSEVESGTQGVTFEGEVDVNYADGFNGDSDVRLRVSAHDTANNFDSERVEVSTVQNPTFGVTVNDTASTTEVTEGQNAVVNATIENTGDITGTQTINFTVDGENAASDEVELDAGNTTTVEFTYTTSADDDGVTAEVFSDDDSDSRDLAVNEKANFAASLNSDDSTTDALTVGDTVTANATITNTGDLEGSQTVNLTVNGTEVDVTETLTLAGGASETVELTYTTDSDNTPEITYNVSSENDTTTTTSVAVNEPANFAASLSEDSTTGPVTEGETVTANATITNNGDLEATQTINLTVNGTVENSTEVTLDGGASETVKLTYTTGEGDAPEITYNVSSDDSVTTDTEVTVNEPANFVAALDTENSTTQEVSVGDTVTANATITNNGDLEATQTINLTVNGTVENSTEVTLASGASETVELTYTTVSDDTPEITYNVSSEDDATDDQVVPVSEQE